MRGQTIKITKKENLKLGTPHHCHQNAYEYARKNKCEFVCGWIGHTPHCICKQNGEYIDPTLNREADFKIFHTYTFREIANIFFKEGAFFIPFNGNYGSVYDGTRKLEDDELREWWCYIAQLQYSDCIVYPKL